MSVEASRRLKNVHKVGIKKPSDTVDGSEILHQLIGGLSHSLQGFIHPRWCTSTVVLVVNHEIRISSLNNQY